MNKYRAKPVGGFPSQLEAKVYIDLARMYGAENIQCQYVFSLSRQINWKIDFKVFSPDSCFFVEAKGFNTDTFGLKLRLLQDLYPDTASRLVIVGTDAKTIKMLKRKHPKTIHINDMHLLGHFFDEYKIREII